MTPRTRGDAVWCAIYAAAWHAEYEREREYFRDDPRYVAPNPSAWARTVDDEKSTRLVAMVFRATRIADAELDASQSIGGES